MTENIEKLGAKEQETVKGTAVPFVPAGIGTRISRAIRLAGGPGTAAELVGVSPESLRRYSKETAKPTFEVMCRLAHVSGVSLAWLASGRGDPAEGAQEDPAEQATRRPLEHIYISGFSPEDIEGIIYLLERQTSLRDLPPREKASFVREFLEHEEQRRHESRQEAEEMLKKGPPQPED